MPAPVRLDAETIERIRDMVNDPRMGVKVTAARLDIGRTTLWNLLSCHVASQIVIRRITEYFAGHSEHSERR
jgi:hypothetical protein